MTGRKVTEVVALYDYEKTSGLVFLIFLMFEGLIATFVLLRGLNLLYLGLAAFFIIAFLGLYRFSLTVFQTSIRITYGMDFYNRSIPLAAIKDFHIVSNDSIFTRLYQPTNGLILEVGLKNGGRVLLAVPDTKAVMEVLNRVRLGASE